MTTESNPSFPVKLNFDVREAPKNVAVIKLSSHVTRCLLKPQLLLFSYLPELLFVNPTLRTPQREEGLHLRPGDDTTAPAVANAPPPTG